MKKLLPLLMLIACSKAKVGIDAQSLTSAPSTTFLSTKCSTEFYNTAPNDFKAQFPDINMTNVTELKAVSTDNIYANYGGMFANSFVGLLNNGKVVAWGSTVTGGDNAAVTALNISPSNPVEKVFSTMLSHVVLLKNGTVKGWGYPTSGANQTDIDALNITSANPVVNIVPSAFGFAFIFQDGTLQTLGYTDLGMSTSLPSNFSQVPGGKKAVSVITNNSAFAALLDDGSVKVWGHTGVGGDQAQVNALNITNAVKLYSNRYAMAALLQDGTVKVWGDTSSGGDQTQVDALAFSSMNPVKEIVSTKNQAFAAILQDGTVKTWGHASYGGDQAQVTALAITSANPVKKIYTTYGSFIALLHDGTVKVWGNNSFGGDQTEVDALAITSANPVKAVFPQNLEAGMTQAAVAAILQDGTVKVWGDDTLGGDQTVVTALGFSSANPVTTIYVNDYTAGSGFGGSFTALLKDGTIKVWGDVTKGGNQAEVDALGITSANPVINIYSSVAANIALLKDGSVKTWGNSATFSPANQSALFANLSTNPVKEMYASLAGFAAVRKDGSVSVWGADTNPSFNFGAVQSEVDALNFGTQNKLRTNAKICVVSKCAAGSIASNAKSCL